MNGYIDYNECGQYLSVIQGISEGKILYRDMVVFYGPLQYWTPVIAMQIFGKSLLTLRGVFMVGNIAIVFLIYIIARVSIRRTFFSYLAIIIIVTQTQSPFWITRYAGFRYLASYLLLLFILLFCRFKKNVTIFFVGIFSVIALFYSLDGGIASFLVCVAFFLMYHFLVPPSERNTTSKVILQHYFFGFLLGVVPFLLWSLANNSLFSYFSQQLLFTPSRLFIDPEQYKYFDARHSYPLIVIALSIFWICFIFRDSTSYYKTVSFIVLAVFGFVFYLFSLRSMNGMAFTNSLPITIVISFFLMNEILDYFFNKAKLIKNQSLFLNQLVLAAMFVICAQFYFQLHNYFYYQEWKSFIDYQINKGKYVPYYAGWWPLNSRGLEYSENQRLGKILIPKAQKDEIAQVDSYIQKYSDAGDPIFCFPDLSFFNFICNRPNISRFTHAVLACKNPRWEEEILTDLERLKPKLIIVRKGECATEKRLRQKTVLNQIRKHIMDNYGLIAELSNFFIYSLRNYNDSKAP